MTTSSNAAELRHWIDGPHEFELKHHKFSVFLHNPDFREDDMKMALIYARDQLGNTIHAHVGTVPLVELFDQTIMKGREIDLWGEENLPENTLPQWEWEDPDCWPATRWSANEKLGDQLRRNIAAFCRIRVRVEQDAELRRKIADLIRDDGHVLPLL